MSQQTLSPLDEVAVNQAVEQALAHISSAQTLEELATAKVAHSGDKSPLVLANRQIGSLEPAQKASAGKLMGQARGRVRAALEQRTEQLEQAAAQALLEKETVDVSVLSHRRPWGARHPLSLLQEEICDFFTGIGWDIAQGPEIEHEWFNFDALNFDADHPARQMQDTFYVDSASVAGVDSDTAEGDAAEGDTAESSANGEAHLVMRTHTSPVQARVLLDAQLPVYVAVPGKVFRSDELDATHTPVFHQVEGLAVDKGLTMAQLKGTLDAFARAMFGPGAKTRFRPSFFPFTEPSAEFDLWFEQKQGGPGWIEWGGCGMVNPNVLRACGIDPEVYQGFAFGMGIERTLMLRHSIADMHDIVEGDVRFSKQFGLQGKGN